MTEPPLASVSREASEDELARALEEANLPTLLLALAHLTGDRRWVEDPYRPARSKGPGDHDSGGFSPELQAQIHREALEVLRAWRAGRFVPAPDPEPEEIARRLGIGLGIDVPEEAGGLLAEELGAASRRVAIPELPEGREQRVVIIGCGFSGLCAAVHLELAGVPYTILEKNDDVGGTWEENTYPACGVDTPTHLYSFSFAQRPDWSRFFTKRDELHRYIGRVAEEFGVRENVRFGTEVTGAAWDPDRQGWRLEVDAGGREEVLDAEVVISAVGFFNRPSYPRIPGLETFAGPCMHTARWRDDVELEGKRVGVLGTGASAMQIVPAIAGTPDRTIVFQRSPQWAIPNPNYMRDVPPAVQLLMAEVPYYAAWYRLRLVWNYGDRLHPVLQIDPDWPNPDRSINAMNERHRRFLTEYIRSELGDRADELMDKCLPTYPPYGKRPLLDNGWFRAVARDDVELVTGDVVEIRPHGVVTADGVEHEVDVLVLATGFQTFNILGPMEIRGRSGRTLREFWGPDDARAYLGMTVPDFPNFFILWGPNTNAGHGGSHVLSAEMQVRYVMQLLAAMRRRDVAAIEVRKEVFEDYNDGLDDALSRTIWTHKGMTTYYRNSQGRIVANIPYTNVQFWNMTRQPHLDGFILEAHAEQLDPA